MNYQGAIDEVLVVGDDDWVSAWELRIATRRFMEPSDDLHAAMVAVVDRLLAGGLVHVGDVTDDGFQPWPLSGGQLLDHARQRLAEVGDEPSADDAFWLCNTEVGGRLATDLLANGYELPE